jgi:hypothetical protein
MTYAGFVRRLLACRYPTSGAALASWERLSAHFAHERTAGIATMRCIGSNSLGETHMVIAAALSDEDADVVARAPWGDDGERCEDDIPELIAGRLYARAARNAAALVREGRSGTFTTRRPEGSRIRFDSSGGYGPERRLYG